MHPGTNTFWLLKARKNYKSASRFILNNLKFNKMVHTTLTAQLHSGIRTRKFSNRSLYNVVVNGENGEYYEWEVEAESYGEASSKGEEFARDLMVDIQYIEVYQLL